MSYETDIECGRELDEDIKSGLLEETGLLPAGRRKLRVYRDSIACPHGEAARMVDIYHHTGACVTPKKSVTELLLGDADE